MAAALVRRTDVPQTLTDQINLCKTLAESQLLPQHLAGKPANLLAIMYAAQAIDVPIWQAVQSMHVVSGKVGMSADLMRALVQRAGHKFRVVESTDAAATVEVERSDDAGHPQRFTFTQADAETAGLWGKGTWRSYPKALLLARATTGICRLAAADALSGMTYTPEELGDDTSTPADAVEPGDGHLHPVAAVNGQTGEIVQDEVARSSIPGQVVDVTDPANQAAAQELGTAKGKRATRTTGQDADTRWETLPADEGIEALRGEVRDAAFAVGITADKVPVEFEARYATGWDDADLDALSAFRADLLDEKTAMGA